MLGKTAGDQLLARLKSVLSVLGGGQPGQSPTKVIWAQQTGLPTEIAISRPKLVLSAVERREVFIIDFSGGKRIVGGVQKLLLSIAAPSLRWPKRAKAPFRHFCALVQRICANYLLPGSRREGIE